MFAVLGTESTLANIHYVLRIFIKTTKTTNDRSFSNEPCLVPDQSSGTSSAPSLVDHDTWYDDDDHHNTMSSSTKARCASNRCATRACLNSLDNDAMGL